MTARKVEHDKELIEFLLISGLGARASMRYALRQYDERQSQPLLNEIAELKNQTDESLAFDAEQYRDSEDALVRMECALKEKDRRISELEAATRPVVRKSTMHNFMGDTGFENAVDELRNAVESKS